MLSAASLNTNNEIINPTFRTPEVAKLSNPGTPQLFLAADSGYNTDTLHDHRPKVERCVLHFTLLFKPGWYFYFPMVLPRFQHQF